MGTDAGADVGADPPLGSVLREGAAVGDTCGFVNAGGGIVDVSSPSEVEGDDSVLLNVETSDVRTGWLPVELMVAL